MKRISGFDDKSMEVKIAEISHLDDEKQAEILADYFTLIPNEYEALKSADIDVPSFSDREIPQFQPNQIWHHLTKIKSNKATASGDLPAKLIKEFAAYLAEPFTDIVNTSFRRGEYPQVYKYETSTPVPKVIPPQKVTQMRNISGLFNFDKVLEKLLSELMVEDMKAKSDPKQFGNKKGTSIDHYLIAMIHRILSAVDQNTTKKKFAVIANLIDWSSAFPRQCPKLGVESFLRNGVRPSIMPLVVNYFQDRYMSVKWHGHKTSPRKINGGGPAGGTLGILEYLSQSNNNADCVSIEDRFKFMDDLTALEIVNLLSIGLASYNVKAQVPSDIIQCNQFIPSANLKSQMYLNEISQWTKETRGKINENKSKVMIFNFTQDHQFSARLTLEGQNLEIVDETKLLGTIVTNDLKWDRNIEEIVKKANGRLELLRKVSSFGASLSDLKNIYVLFIRSLLEQSCTVWHSGLTVQNKQDLERIQKTSLKIILQEKYLSYEQALKVLDLETLDDRRENLCKSFAKKSLKNGKMKEYFVKNEKKHLMETRNPNEYKVTMAHTERMKKSPIIYMQNILNH